MRAGVQDRVAVRASPIARNSTISIFLTSMLNAWVKSRWNAMRRPSVMAATTPARPPLRHICRGEHGDPDLRLSQRGCIVHAVDNNDPALHPGSPAGALVRRHSPALPVDRPVLSPTPPLDPRRRPIHGVARHSAGQWVCVNVSPLAMAR